MIMTTILPEYRPGMRRRIALLVLALGLLGGVGTAVAAPPSATQGQAAPSDRNSWLKSTAIFLVITAGGGYVWYFGLFPRLLGGKNPSWPLDAWRKASYGAWLTMCAAAWFFKGPLVRLLRPYLLGTVNSTFIDYVMELVLLPLVALVGLLVIWNYRREASNREWAS